jgi:large subunit ribosomal protein L10
LKREEKTAVVEDIAGQIEAAEAIFAIDYRGISVPQAADLRSRLRESEASFRVVKNRLTRLAADRAGREELKELLDGPTALTFIRGDAALAAKTIATFDREHEVLVFKGGFMEGMTLDEDSFKSIARLPGRDVLNGQLAGVVASPLTGLARGLGSMISGLAIALGQVAERGLVGGEAPAEEGAADEPPAEEPAAEETPAEETPPEETPAEEPPSEEAPGESSTEEPAADPAAAESERAEPESDESGGDASEPSTPPESNSETSSEQTEEE